MAADPAEWWSAEAGLPLAAGADAEGDPQSVQSQGSLQDTHRGEAWWRGVIAERGQELLNDIWILEIYLYIYEMNLK